MLKSKDKKLIIVNKQDKVLGYKSKGECHRLKGIFHRAFSIFVINDKNEILLQKRSKYKLLWPLFWSNTCCSHPNAKGAKINDAKDVKKDLIKQAEKRLKEEMGFSCGLKPIFKFQYQAVYKNIGSENELVAVLLGKYGGQKIKPDLKEAAGFKWISLKDLINQIKKSPEEFTPWFKKIIKDRRFLREIKR